MDLGFGDKNQEIGQATARALMRGAEVQEKGLESEMAQYDRLLDDEVSRDKVVNAHLYFLKTSLLIMFSCDRTLLRTSDKNASNK